MTLKFAKKWNFDYDKRQGIIKVAGKDFGYVEAINLLKVAVNDIQGGGLRDSIDKYEARVTRAPHKSPPPKPGSQKKHIPAFT